MNASFKQYSGFSQGEKYIEAKKTCVCSKNLPRASSMTSVEKLGVSPSVLPSLGAIFPFFAC